MVNIFDRLNGNAINLDGRDGPLDTQQPGDDTYTLTLVIAPTSAEPNQLFGVTVQARKNGQAIANQEVSIGTTNAGAGLVPASVTTNSSGNAQFSIIALALGTATISASIVVDGDTYNANSVEITVTSITPPVDADATGYGQAILSIETALAGAMIPRVQRLSDQEQRRKYPNDTGLSRVGSYENLEVTFLPTFLQ